MIDKPISGDAQNEFEIHATFDENLSGSGSRSRRAKPIDEDPQTFHFIRATTWIPLSTIRNAIAEPSR